jgi:hypothetical protein
MIQNLYRKIKKNKMLFKKRNNKFLESKFEIMQTVSIQKAIEIIFGND